MVARRARPEAAKRRRWAALAWGALSIVPTLFTAYHVLEAMRIVSRRAAVSPQDVTHLESLARLQLMVNVLTLLLVVAYIVYLFRTQHVAGDKKALWAVVLILGNVVAMPVFWYLHVWRPLGAPEARRWTGRGRNLRRVDADAADAFGREVRRQRSRRP